MDRQAQYAISDEYKGSVDDLFKNAAQDGVLVITSQEDMTFFGKILTNAIREDLITHTRNGPVATFKMVK